MPRARAQGRGDAHAWRARPHLANVARLDVIVAAGPEREALAQALGVGIGHGAISLEAGALCLERRGRGGGGNSGGFRRVAAGGCHLAAGAVLTSWSGTQQLKQYQGTQRKDANLRTSMHFPTAALPPSKRLHEHEASMRLLLQRGAGKEARNLGTA